MHYAIELDNQRGDYGCDSVTLVEKAVNEARNVQAAERGAGSQRLLAKTKAAAQNGRFEGYQDNRELRRERSTNPAVAGLSKVHHTDVSG